MNFLLAREDAEKHAGSKSCFYCNKVFHNYRALGGHLRIHQEDKTLRNLNFPGNSSNSVDITRNPPASLPNSRQNMAGGNNPAPFARAPPPIDFSKKFCSNETNQASRNKFIGSNPGAAQTQIIMSPDNSYGCGSGATYHHNSFTSKAFALVGANAPISSAAFALSDTVVATGRPIDSSLYLGSKGVCQFNTDEFHISKDGLPPISGDALQNMQGCSPPPCSSQDKAAQYERSLLTCEGGKRPFLADESGNADTANASKKPKIAPNAHVEPENLQAKELSEGVFDNKTWEKVQVGDVVKVEKDQFFPADLLLLSSDYEDGICYVETMNLDGETNLKVKRALEVTLPLDEDDDFKNFTGTIKCEDPNPSLYTFVGNFEYDGQVYALDPSQILLRDSKLRNTAFVYGIVIFTGHDSKVMQNATKSPSKRSRIERKMDCIIYVLFSLLLVTSFISSIGFAVKTKFYMPDWWYMQPQDTDDYYNPKKPLVSGVTHLVTAFMLYGYLIPISLYVSIEVVKVLQASFINQDIQMYDEETGNPAQARTSNLNEELGQVDTILSDKTGTLTCNQMDFLKCSIAGTAYGVCSSEVELAAAQQMAIDLEDQDAERSNGSRQKGKRQDIELETVVTSKGEKDRNFPIKGFSFEDSRIMKGNWLKEPNADEIMLFFRILAVCHTAIPELNEETGSYTYEAESPDEGAFLVAAREFGFEFFKRTQSSVFVHERYSASGQPIDSILMVIWATFREFKILNVLEFTSKRKRMTVIVRDEDGQILLFCKGADSIIFDRLSKNGRFYEEDTTRHLNEYGEAGLRTLALAYRKLEESEYSAWNNEFQKAKTSFGADRETMLEKVAEMMERDLILLGATAVEDKLQKGVPQCIDKLAQAGLKIWVLTGDKMETAINIGYACSLLRQGMKQICVTAISSDAKEVIKENILIQITNASQTIKLEKDPHAAFALIIDGKTLAYALEDDMKLQFLGLAVECASVICCRVSPKQKALVTRLVKEGTGKTTLAIGDGANDVGMIQEADIGVGISGVEGMQAVMASDFSVAQFRFLERLLVVHGHWCYKRIAQMICYSFYKNIAFGLTLFYFEAFTGFSGQSVYDDWYMLLFNVVLTSLPVISLGVFEQDVSSEVCLQFAALYQQGPRNLFFDWYRILGWMGNGLYSSLIIFFLNIIIFYNQAFRAGGQTVDMAALGTTMFTCIIWALNCQIALTMSHFTWIQHLAIWGSIAAWYLFLFVYGMLSPAVSGDAYQILVEALAPAPIYWAATLLVTVACNLPYLAHICLQRCFHPLDHHIIQEIKYYKKDVEDQRMWSRERSKARQKTKIGFTARVDAKIRQLRGKLQRKQPSF